MAANQRPSASACSVPSGLSGTSTSRAPMSMRGRRAACAARGRRCRRFRRDARSIGGPANAAACLSFLITGRLVVCRLPGSGSPAPASRSARVAVAPAGAAGAPSDCRAAAFPAMRKKLRSAKVTQPAIQDGAPRTHAARSQVPRATGSQRLRSRPPVPGARSKSPMPHDLGTGPGQVPVPRRRCHVIGRRCLRRPSTSP